MKELATRKRNTICPRLSKKFGKTRTNAHNISIHRLDTNSGAKLVRNFRTSQFDENDMKYTFCPILLEKFEYPRTNGQTKAGISNLETPAHY